MNNSLVVHALSVSAFLRYYSKRLAGEKPVPFAQMARTKQRVGSPGRIRAIRPIIWERHLTRISGAAIGLSNDQLFKNIHRDFFEFESVEIYCIQNVALFGGALYFPSYRVQLAWPPKKMLGAKLIGSCKEVADASLAATETGSRYFGHWVWDELPLQALTSPYGQPVSHERNIYFHESGIRKAVGLSEPLRLTTAWFTQLTIANDPPVSPHKTRRLLEMRKRLLSAPEGKSRIFFIRGSDGERRSLANQDELAKRLEMAGFVTFSPEGKTFEEVLHVCNKAEMLVTVEGSHATPAFIFMRPGGRLVILNPPHRSSTILPDLGLFVGLRGAMFIGEPVHDSKTTFRVDPDELLRFIEYVELVSSRDSARLDGFYDELLSWDSV